MIEKSQVEPNYVEGVARALLVTRGALMRPSIAHGRVVCEENPVRVPLLCRTSHCSWVAVILYLRTTSEMVCEDPSWLERTVA